MDRSHTRSPRLPEAQTCGIGLDVGGTKIAAGLVAFPSGRVLARRTIPTRAGRGGQAVLSYALEVAQELMQEEAGEGREVCGIGVGVAELVDPAGRITSAQSFDWRELAVQESFARLAPATVEADVRAAALAEARFGAGQSYKTFVYVTVGTGISSSLVQDGRPYPGARGNALVLASGAFSTTCPACGAETDFVLEEFAAGPALVARYNRERPGSAARGEDVTAAADGGNPVAVAVVRTAGAALGNSVGFLVNVLDPEAVIVGGGLGLAGGLYWESFVAATRAHIWAEASRDVPVLPAALGPDAGAIGAAAAAWLRWAEQDGGGTETRCQRTS